ncbi:hypothetical protein [Brucella intermedia]|uniref:hypothetical protein n=1 Tax=Brucella intermedia TaxID=94625 RepID=UPI00124D869F|nr:hypothetical protein [Brucella intermedia]KAB2723337.1 hypothetical protein F9L02_22375 [Brucella intermedia]
MLTQASQKVRQMLASSFPAMIAGGGRVSPGACTSIWILSFCLKSGYSQQMHHDMMILFRAARIKAEGTQPLVSSESEGSPCKANVWLRTITVLKRINRFSRPKTQCGVNLHNAVKRAPILRELVDESLTQLNRDVVRNGLVKRASD